MTPPDAYNPSLYQRIVGRLMERIRAGEFPAGGYLPSERQYQVRRPAGNPIYLVLSQAMFEWLSKFHVDLVRVLRAERLVIDEPRLIFERIAGHDTEGGAAAMTAHLMRANRLY